MNRITQLVIKVALAVSLTTGLSHTVLAQVPMTEAKNDDGYQDLGGKAGISKIIDDFLVIWQADARISRRLTNADTDRLGALLKEQIAQLTGAPVTYSGKSMKEAHAEMGIRNVEFNALAEDLQLAMEKNAITSRAQNKLLAKLAPMQKQIVEK